MHFSWEYDTITDATTTEFQSACLSGNLHRVKELYNAATITGINVLEDKDNYGRRPIHYAVYGYHYKVLAFIVKVSKNRNTLEADINSKDKMNLTALQIAVRIQSSKCAKLLIKEGCDINSVDSFGDTAAHNAMYVIRANCLHQKSNFVMFDILSCLTKANSFSDKLQNWLGLTFIEALCKKEDFEAVWELLFASSEKQSTPRIPARKSFYYPQVRNVTDQDASELQSTSSLRTRQSNLTDERRNKKARFSNRVKAKTWVPPIGAEADDSLLTRVSHPDQQKK